jgi:8-oxo-dGTP diphosphatase
LWAVPGGQIEVGESVLDGLRREIMEEAGVEVEIGALVGIYSNIKPPTKVMMMFLAEWTSGDPRPSHETPEVAWVARDSALGGLVPSGPHQDRLRDMLEFTGQLTYRVYSTNPYVVVAETPV